MKVGDLVICRTRLKTKGAPKLKEYIAIYLNGHTSRSECCVFVYNKTWYVSTRDIKVIA